MVVFGSKSPEGGERIDLGVGTLDIASYSWHTWGDLSQISSFVTFIIILLLVHSASISGLNVDQTTGQRHFRCVALKFGKYIT